MSSNSIVHCMQIHRSAIGHVVGRNGRTIKRIQADYDVNITNTKFGQEEDIYIHFYVKGHHVNVSQALKYIGRLIEISNEWCRKNNYKYG